MVSMALEAGDAATWGSTVTALFSLFITLQQTRSQRRELERQNELQAEVSQLQRRQIEAAERRALAMEILLSRLSTSQLAPRGNSDPVPPPAPVPGPWVPSQDRGASGGYGAAKPSATPAPEPPMTPGGAASSTSRRPQQPQDAAPAAPVVPQQGGYGFPQPATPGTHGRSPWLVERWGPHTYGLRNLSGETLTKVRINPSNLPPVVRNLPEEAVVRPNESVEFLMAGTSGSPVPPEVWVSWEGQDQEVAVPLP